MEGKMGGRPTYDNPWRLAAISPRTVLLMPLRPPSSFSHHLEITLSHSNDVLLPMGSGATGSRKDVASRCHSFMAIWVCNSASLSRANFDLVSADMTTPDSLTQFSSKLDKAPGTG